jgi:hypothetical protein
MRRMTGSTLKPDVPKGPATITGYTATFVGLVAMLLAFIFPEGDEQTLGVIASGVVALGALVVTSLGRQRQAVAQIHAQGQLESAKIYEQSQVKPDADEGPQPDIESLRDLTRAALRDARTAEEKTPLDDEVVYLAQTPGLDPEYDGRDESLETRLKLEQREACQ